MIRRQESYERQWALTSASQPWRDPKEQRRVWRIAEQIGQIGRGRRRRAFELLESDDQRSTFIGCELKVHGERWARNNPEAMAWLESRGISRAAAIASHEDWLQREMSNPFFTPAKKRRRQGR